MQQKVKKGQPFKAGSKQKKEMSFPLEKDNFVIIGIGIILIVIGYILMAQNSVDGFVPTIVSPILLFLGYCVAIPYGILKRPGKTKIMDAGASAVETTAAAAESAKPNIKTG
jgi:hypothetical protein